MFKNGTLKDGPFIWSGLDWSDEFGRRIKTFERSAIDRDKQGRIHRLCHAYMLEHIGSWDKDTTTFPLHVAALTQFLHTFGFEAQLIRASINNCLLISHHDFIGFDGLFKNKEDGTPPFRRIPSFWKESEFNMTRNIINELPDEQRRIAWQQVIDTTHIAEKPEYGGHAQATIFRSWAQEKLDSILANHATGACTLSEEQAPATRPAMTGHTPQTMISDTERQGEEPTKAAKKKVVSRRLTESDEEESKQPATGGMAHCSATSTSPVTKTH